MGVLLFTGELTILNAHARNALDDSASASSATS